MSTNLLRRLLPSSRSEPEVDLPMCAVITPMSDYERRYGKATLLTNYDIDVIVAALVQTDFDSDLVLKLRILRNEHVD